MTKQEAKTYLTGIKPELVHSMYDADWDYIPWTVNLEKISGAYHQNQLKQWVTELRSGVFKQGNTFLHLEGQFCCVGVLYYCVGNVPKSKLGRNKTPTFEGFFHSVNVFQELKTQKADGIFYKMNDNFKLSFNQIADFIEHFLIV